MKKKAVELHDTINIAPKSISTNELLIKINEIKVKILSVQKVVEYARGSYLYGYLVQILKPKEKKVTDKYDKITIILHSKETGEYGKGELFIEKNK